MQEQENKRRVYGRVREEGGEVEEVALHLMVLARQEEVHGRQRVGHGRQRVGPSPREKLGRCNCFFVFFAGTVANTYKRIWREFKVSSTDLI